MEKIFCLPNELFDLKKTNIFYGTGIRSKERLRLLLEQNVKVDYIGDSDSGKWGTYIEGILCISHDEIKKYKGANLIIGSYIFRKEICERMLSLGLSADQIFYDNYSEEMDDSLLG